MNQPIACRSISVEFEEDSVQSVALRSHLSGDETPSTNSTKAHDSRPSSETWSGCNYWTLFGFLTDGWARLPPNHDLPPSRIESGDGLSGHEAVEQLHLWQRTGEFV